MFIAGNFIAALAEVIGLILNLYMWVIIIRALISWVNPDPYNPVVQLLYKVTEPVLQPVRRLVPAHRVGIDLSPLIVILVIIFLRSFLLASMLELAQRIR